MRYKLLILSILYHITLNAQLKGTVFSENGEPLTGAQVRWENAKAGVTTNYDGGFEIDYPNSVPQKLITTYIGFNNDTTLVSKNEHITITLIPYTLDEVTVTTRGRGVLKVSGAENSMLIGRQELFKAACCNLGESFTTNPSVDVSYDDAATGAKQIKLLGLSGSYVQMLTENIPAFRGAAHPYSLGYVPGPWMQSIQVSKGSSSVKNGFESITGQINIEYLKPQAEDETVGINLYGDSKAKFEANADANIHINEKLSSALLFHYEDRYKSHDGNNDGFTDLPDIKQFNIMNRWGYFSEKRITQALVSIIEENRKSGVSNHGSNHLDPKIYDTNLNTTHFDGWIKNAWIIDSEKNTNIAIMGSITRHLYDGEYGADRSLYTKQTNAYGQLFFETDFDEHNSLSTGIGIAYDYFHHNLNKNLSFKDRETTAGAYAQYTYKLEDKLVVMAGLRYDNSSIYNSFITPRMHIKWVPIRSLTFRGSVGKGYRTVNPWAEYGYLLASSLPISVTKEVNQEKAWNYGISSSFSTSLFGRPFTLSAEYYFTDFNSQIILDRDSNPGEIAITNLNGKSYSHTFQVDLNYELFDGLTLMAAYRKNDVKETYSGRTMTKPLTADYKSMVSLSYLTPLELWQFDMTIQLTGGGRLPKSPFFNNSALYSENYANFAQLSGQVTRHFRHFSIYAGGENLTGYKQKNPIINIPEIGYYDPTLIYAPLHGAMFYAGIRLKLKYK